MRLIRIKLENWRGVQSSEIVLDAGVTIIEGANEAGKSSFIEALNLLFRERDSTKKQELKRVTPKGVDAGSFVEVELKTGDYHFTYCKTFNKKPSTSLFIHAPHNQQLTGSEAHDRVQAMLDETIDFGLWQAIQLEQGNDFTQVNLKSSDSLAQALDTAAGGTGAGDGESVLLDKVKAEYLRYYTERTAKETGELAKTRELVSSLEQRIEDTAQTLQSMESSIERSARLAREYQTSQAAIPAMQKQLDQHEQAQLQSVALLEKQKGVDAQIEAQRMKVQTIQAKLEERSQASKLLKQKRVDLQKAQVLLTDLQDKEQQAAKKFAVATADRARLTDNRIQIDDELHVVELALQLRDKQAEADLLVARLARIVEVREQLGTINKQVSTLLVDDKTLKKIDSLERDRREQEVRLSARSPELKITALQDVSVTVDGDVQQLTRQQSLQPDTSSSVSVQISDLVSVDLTPASGLSELQFKLSTADNKLKNLLQQCGVDSVAQAAEAQRQRSVLESQKEGLQARIGELLESASEDDLQQRQRELQQKIIQLEKQIAKAKSNNQKDVVGTGDLFQQAEVVTDDIQDFEEGQGFAEEKDFEGAQVFEKAQGLEETQQQLRNKIAAADRELQAVRQARDDAQLHKATIDTELEVARQRHLSDKAVIETMEQQLQDSRSQLDDSALSADLAKEQQVLKTLQASVTDITQQSVGQSLDDADSLVKNTRAALSRANSDLHEIEKESVEVRARLDHLQAEGLHEKLELLRAEHDDASARLQQLQRSASAAMCLWNSLCHHQRVAQLSYARPLAERVAQMGRLVFGNDFSVQLSESLTIESRTLHGLTVPFSDLSGGAREQLGILLRLAAAGLVSGEQGMPLILDDTLGHTDPDRLETMGAILSNAGRHAQIVVMTCYPRRYGYVGEAKLVKLAGRTRDAAPLVGNH